MTITITRGKRIAAVLAVGVVGILAALFYIQFFLLRPIGSGPAGPRVADAPFADLGHGSHCRQFWRATYVADDPHYWYYDNIEDPNDRGYDAIRRAFLNTIIENSELLRRPH